MKEWLPIHYPDEGYTHLLMSPKISVECLLGQVLMKMIAKAMSSPGGIRRGSGISAHPMVLTVDSQTVKTRTVKSVAFSNFGSMNNVSNARAGYPPGGERMFESGCQGAAEQKPPGLVNSLLLLPKGVSKPRFHQKMTVAQR